MAFFDAINQLIHCNVIYCGPATSGKSSSIRHIASNYAQHQQLIYPLQRYAHEEVRLVSCSVLGQQQLGAWRLHLHCLGQAGAAMDVRYIKHWISIADAIIFVADSQRHKLQENIRQLQHIARIQTANKRNFSKLPLVLHYTKRDLQGSLPIETLQRYLNPLAWDYAETNAAAGPVEPIVAALHMFETRLIAYLKQAIIPSLAPFARLLGNFD
ncbi:P-loop NTPase family protein [Herpetosiphon geysericola]|uniref:hypothetical protein n=1 Tax=Herpetosiphon geysericola TaxID=70996 RepID=UPI0006C929E0|nr:hypothetical protein [Herpetosiphon geysericola]